MTATAHDAIAFERAIAAWNERLRCESPTLAGIQCERAAHWRLNLHGCEHGLLCGQHLRTWERAAAETSTGRCAHCGFCFERPVDAYTVTPL